MDVGGGGVGAGEDAMGGGGTVGLEVQVVAVVSRSCVGESDVQVDEQLC